MRRKIAALACAGMLGLCLVYSGCSASSAAQSYDSAYSTSNESSIAVEEPMEWGMGETAEGGMSDTAQGTTSMTAQEVESAAAGEERKIIRTASLYIESREFDQSLSYLEQKVAEFGGYVESSTLEGNSYWNDSCRTATTPCGSRRKISTSLSGRGRDRQHHQQKHWQRGDHFPVL